MNSPNDIDPLALLTAAGYLDADGACTGQHSPVIIASAPEATEADRLRVASLRAAHEGSDSHKDFMREFGDDFLATRSLLRDARERSGCTDMH